MRTKKGFMLRTVAGKNIVVPVGDASRDFNGLITQYETGAFLWKKLSEGCTYDELLASLLSEYDATEEQAKVGIDAFLKIAKDANLIEED